MVYSKCLIIYDGTGLRRDLMASRKKAKICHTFKNVNIVERVIRKILYRFNIPIIGITDGDLDKVVEDGFKADKSVIFELESGHDDIVGGEIFNEIFKGNFILELPKSKGNISDIKNSIIEILNNINCKYNIKDI